MHKDGRGAGAAGTGEALLACACHARHTSCSAPLLHQLWSPRDIRIWLVAQRSHSADCKHKLQCSRQ